MEPKAIPAVVVSDPNDDMFLACAVAASADVVVSGDRHLLDLGQFQGIPIVDTAEFLRLWQSNH